MLNTFDTSRSYLKRLLIRTGVWRLAEWTGLHLPLGRLRRWLVPVLRRRSRALWRDYQDFRARHGTYLNVPCPASGRKLLVVSLSDWVAQVKLEAILAKALQFRGYTPAIASYRHQVDGHRFHRLFGFRDIVFIDRCIPRGARHRAEIEATRLLNRRPSFASVLALEHRGVQVGRHVLSSLVSYLRNGAVAFEDPTVSRMLGAGLAEAIMLTEIAERLLEQAQPDLALFLERGYMPFAPVFDVAINCHVPVIQYCQCHRADSFILKRYGKHNRSQHPWSLSPASWDRVQRMPWSPAHEADLMHELRSRYENGQWFNRKYLQVGKTIKSADEVRRQLGLDAAKKTAVIFSHVLWDATFFYGTNLFDDYEHWLVETVRAACANSRVNWVVKLHPDYVWKMKRAGDTRRPPEYAALESKVGRLPDHVKILEPQTDISTFSLFDVTDWCLTVRGTIGVEMPCFGIAVLTAGTGRYSGLGFTVDSASRAEYLDRLHHIQNVPPLSAAQVALARRHAYALLRLRPYPFQTFAVVQDNLDRLGHALDHNVVLRTTSATDFRQASDLCAFAEWAAGTDQEDFLGPPTDTGLHAKGTRYGTTG